MPLDVPIPPEQVAEQIEHRRRQGAPLTGLVLSGGGARGAYEAGVIRYIRDELPPKVRAHARMEIICGTSVGAINGCFLAANAHQPELQGRALTSVWERLRIEGVYKVTWRELSRLPKFLWGSRGRGQLDDLVAPGRLGGLLNTAPMEQLVRRGMRWNNIQRNTESGDLYALAINATHISTGKVHTFVQRQGGGIPPWSTDPGVEARATTIGPHHPLASAAIPWIFPAVEIEGDVYCDGGLKLNTPISPALRLGADRILVIGLNQEIPEEDAPTIEPETSSVDQFPSAPFLLGKILNALLSDKTGYDLSRLKRFNAILEAGEKAFGDRFATALGEAITPLRGAPYRKITTLMIQPQGDIAKIADKYARLGSVAARAGGLIGPVIRRIADSGDEEQGDLLSYLLFDGEFASDLVRMGMRDADAKRQELIDFFAV